jgi:hypothetical protein
MATAKPGQKISIDKLQATLEKLERLEEKPKEELSLRDSIYFLRDKLRLALKRGYSYQDLSELLEQQEILVSAATLKQYLTETDKGATKRKRATKSVKAKQPATEAISPEQTKAIPETSAKESSGQPKADLPESSAAIPETSVTESRETQRQSDKEDRASEQRSNSESVKRKQRGLSKSSKDLSSEFNQY